MASLKEMAAGRDEIFFLDPSIIEEIPHYNVRDLEAPETVAHIRKMADAIKEGGTLSFPPITISREKDGRILLYAGYCRRRAFLLARSEGAEFKGIPSCVNRQSDIERTFDLLASNDSLPLTQLEQAAVVQRLLDMGLTQAEISRKRGVSQTAIANLITILSAPDAVKDLIQKGEISGTLAAEEIKNNPDLAEKKLTDAVENAKSKGKKKATKKDIESDTESAKPCPFCKGALTEIAGEGEFEHPTGECILEGLAFGIDKLSLWNKRGK